MWHLAGARWSGRERRFSESWRDYHVERGTGGMRPRDVQQSPRGQRGGVDLMIPVQGHLTLLQRQPESILMIYAVILRWCYRTCLRACGSASRMRGS
jgi:hypothetical protein